MEENPMKRRKPPTEVTELTPDVARPSPQAARVSASVQTPVPQIGKAAALLKQIVVQRIPPDVPRPAIRYEQRIPGQARQAIEVDPDNAPPSVRISR